MNVIINTPILSSASSKRSYDNNILYLFLSVFVIVILMGVLYVDITSRNPI